MSRCRFVQPEVVRLNLLEMAKRRLPILQQELDQLITEKKPAAEIDAKRQAIAAHALRIARVQDDPEEDPGAFIDIKRQLNAGEQRRVFTRMMRDVTPGERTKLDPAHVGITKLVEYIIGWSFTDPTGQPVPFSEAAIENLDMETYTELVETVDQHEEAEDARRKNAQIGATRSEVI